MKFHKKPFARKLRALIKERGVTQAWLSEEVGVTPASVSDWVNAKKLPDTIHFEKMCIALKTTESHFDEPTGPTLTSIGMRPAQPPQMAPIVEVRDVFKELYDEIAALKTAIGPWGPFLQALNDASLAQAVDVAEALKRPDLIALAHQAKGHLLQDIPKKGVKD